MPSVPTVERQEAQTHHSVFSEPLRFRENMLAENVPLALDFFSGFLTLNFASLVPCFVEFNKNALTTWLQWKPMNTYLKQIKHSHLLLYLEDIE